MRLSAAPGVRERPPHAAVRAPGAAARPEQRLRSGVVGRKPGARRHRPRRAVQDSVGAAAQDLKSAAERFVDEVIAGEGAGDDSDGADSLLELRNQHAALLQKVSAICMRLVPYFAGGAAHLVAEPGVNVANLSPSFQV